MHHKITSIVLTWNNYKDTKECIVSLLRSSLPFTSIIVVDNGSQDDSFERLKRDFKNFPSIYFISNPTNYGFAKGMNVGIQRALSQETDYIFLINNDTIIDIDCIKRLHAVMVNEQLVGITGPRIFYYTEPQRVWHGGGYYSQLKMGVVVPEKNKLGEKCDGNTRQVTFLTGCAMLIKQEVFQKVGLLDEDYFLYEEDVDFCLRAVRAGFKLLYVPSAKVWHKIETIPKDRTSPFILYHMARSRIIFLRKNFSWPYFLYGLLIHLLLYTPFRFLQIILGSRSLKSVWAWLHGTWAGLWQPLQSRSDSSYPR